MAKSEAVNQRRTDYTMANQKRKSEKDRLYNGQSETVNQRRTNYTLTNQKP
jgi:hypothetical protein